MGHVRPVAGPGKVGIIISLTLNKWPSRVWRDPGSGGWTSGLGSVLGTGTESVGGAQKLSHYAFVCNFQINNC